MSLVTGELYWTKKNKIINKYSYLSEDIECDVLIIGGGITGAICSYYLSEAGINSVIVDKNIIGYGSTSASTSILQYEIDNNILGLKGFVGISKAVEAFKLCHKAVYDMKDIIDKLDDKCDFQLKECFYYSNKCKDIEKLKEEFDLRKQHGFNVEFIDKNIGKQRFSFPIKAGIYSKDGAAEIDPYRFTHALIKYAVKKGSTVFENTEIVESKTEGNYEVFTTKNGFKIKTKKVIVAKGYEAIKDIDKKIAKFTRSFTIVTKPLDNFEGWYNKCIIRDTNNSYTYIRSTMDNRIIIGGEDIDVGGMRSKAHNLSNDDPLSIEKFSILEERLKNLFPNINNIEIEYKFSGLFGETKDSLPYIGTYEQLPNYYFCMGYGSNGILYDIIGGQIIRDLYLGNNPGINIFSFKR